ncbi:hypothetical protein GCM10023189_45170 [Nibrella saemangeumensis]|uniref:Membrane fusion protein, cobalt-zinc-cadmium efflux system n=1 Tax=Nibrella saemangeumensis TaxID=1084526 RepID=A0ABP8NCQ0_9BACT
MRTNLLFSVLLLSLAACQPQADTTTEGTGPAAAKTTQTAEAHEEAPVDLVELTPDQLRIGGVELGQVEYRNLSPRLQVNGRLAVPAQSQVNITALQGGFVRSLPLLPGQPVRKGQLLARIENPDLIQLQQDYAENRSRLTYLETEFARQQELSRENVSALKVLQQTTADLNGTRARVAGLAKRIQLVGLSPQAALNGRFSANYAVTAPVSGVVTNVPATAGQYVQPADVIAQVTSNQGLYAELTVFEKDLPKIEEGQRVTIRLTNEAGKERTGRITYINRAIDADRSVRVVARLDQPDGRLVPNTFLKASLDLGDSRLTALPEGAIVSAEGKDYIFIQTEEKIPGGPEHAEGEAETPSTDLDHPSGGGERAQAGPHQAGPHQAGPHQAGPHQAGQAAITFRRVEVRRGVTEEGFSQVVLPTGFNPENTRVVVKGAYAVLSQLNVSSGEEEGHGH